MTTRRQLLKAMAALPAAGSVPALLQPPVASARADTASGGLWRNWSGLQRADPATQAAPAGMEELRSLIAKTAGTIRPVGSGHSFTPLMTTDDVMVNMGRFQGISSHDDGARTATLGAGTSLIIAGSQLEGINQAFPTMPDFAGQTLAGALATATHGSGAQLQCMSGYVEGLSLLTASGEHLSCDADNNPELFQAARVNLGALGVVTDVRLRNDPSYRLEKTLEWHPIETILDQADEQADQHRSFEFFYIPFSGWGFTTVQDKTEAAPTDSEKTDQNEGLHTLRQLRDWLSWAPWLRGFGMDMYFRTLPSEYSVASSWQSYSHSRQVRFNEMEYHLPRETGLQAFREIRERVERDFPEVFFPMEIRYVKADDIWLSPFQHQDCISIAVHRHHAEDHRPLFEAVEPIFRRHGGRPHWGKLHSLKAGELKALYPNWKDFLAVREELDPAGRFLNPYLRNLFGLEGA